MSNGLSTNFSLPTGSMSVNMMKSLESQATLSHSAYYSFSSSIGIMPMTLPSLSNIVTLAPLAMSQPYFTKRQTFWLRLETSANPSFS